MIRARRSFGMATQSGSTTEATTRKSLILPAVMNFLVGVIAFGVMIFLPAGTLNYWQAWVVIVIFMGLTSATGVYFSIKDPALVQRRQQAGPAAEQSRGQKIFITAGYLANIAMLVVSGFDHRFGWSHVPTLVALAGDVLVVLSSVMYFIVYQVNSFAASTVQTFVGQRVISTGPYALVRHPKYVGDMLLVIGVPLALGSWWGLAVTMLVLPALVWRILDEEKLLKKDLPGYTEYTHKVRYRLVPHIW
jgi:protein-S-isoprenylcysteine O-methyltransferase Ste14